MGFFVGELSPESYKQALVHRLLKPTIYGNTINWLGEKNRRLPAPVYWHNPTKTPYGWLNLLREIRAWFKWSLPTVGIENMKLQRRRLSPIITNKATGSPGHWSALVKSFAIEHEAVFRLLRRALIRDLLINPIDNVQEIPRIFCCDTYNSLGLHGPFRPDRFVNVTNVWEKKLRQSMHTKASLSRFFWIWLTGNVSRMAKLQGQNVPKDFSTRICLDFSIMAHSWVVESIIKYS